MTRDAVRRSALACLAALAACTGPAGVARRSASDPGRAATWIVARDAPSPRAVAAAPALVARALGTTGAPEVLAPTRTRIAVTVVGPIARIARTKAYAPARGQELFVSFTPPAAPARQDWALRIGSRALEILVRDRAEAEALVRARHDAMLVVADADGRVTIPAGTAADATLELAVDTTGLVPWHEGAYELTVPRAPDGDVSLVADVYGPGPIVVVSSPSHAIDAQPASVEHLRVAVREPATLRDDDFVLRYRVDPADRPGALLVDADGAGTIVGLVVHPFESGHEPVAVRDVTIDWNGATVTEMIPATIGPVAPGTPILVLARAVGDVRGPVVLHASVGRETRTVSLSRDDAIPRDGAAALPLLWARAANGAGPRR